MDNNDIMISNADAKIAPAFKPGDKNKSDKGFSHVPVSDLRNNIYQTLFPTSQYPQPSFQML